MPADPAAGSDDRRSVLRLLLLLDKKPGHFHQTEGVALALGRVAQVEATRLKVRQRPFILVGMLRLAMKLKLSPRFGLRALYGIRLEDVAPPDGIIASGRATAAAAILLARHFKVPLVFSGLVKGYDRRDITLQLSRGAHLDGKPGYANVPKPTMVDQRRFQPAPILATASDLRGARLALLVGGDATDHRFSRDEWDRIVALVAETHAELGVTWHVSTSRRTPPFLTPLLAGLAASGVIAEFVDFATAGPGSANHLFGMDAVVVTQDSHSMVAEALAAQRTVMALKPRDVTSRTITNDIRNSTQSGQLRVLDIETLTPALFAETLLALRVVPAPDPWERIAAAVAPLLGLPAAGGDQTR